MHQYLNILVPRLSLNSHAWYYFDHGSQQVLIQHKIRTITLLCDEPCSQNSGANTAWLKPTRRRMNTYQQHPYYLTLQWHDPHSPLLFLADMSQSQTQHFFCCTDFLSDLYHEDQRERNKAMYLLYRHEIRQSPSAEVLSQLKGHISQWLKI